MHEYALADAVIRAALQTAEQQGLRRITRVVVKIGELQQIRADVFEDALREVLPSDEPRIDGIEVEVLEDPARLCCRVCGRVFTAREAAGDRTDDETEAIHFVPELAHAFFSCPGCASPDFEVEGGRGVSLEALEGEVDDDEGA
jgi:hydrogenase nickel incorporation protein HypA/HybF